MSTECVNMNYYFNVSYFDKLKDIREFKKISSVCFADENRKIFTHRYPVNESPVLSVPQIKTFSLFTTYPGLLIGTGYAHDFKGEDTDKRSGTGERGRTNDDQPVKVGFYFDYVNGLPVIPGSSVKGLLRSYFPDPTKKNQKNKDELGELIRALTGKEKLDVGELLKNIYENGDVFFDAIPVISDKQQIILAEDYITPHKNPLKGPNAIRVLKVKPNVEYRFSFILRDYQPADPSKEGLTREEKLDLFKELILLGGIGAKTNVGYGQFSDTQVAAARTVDRCSQENTPSVQSRPVPNPGPASQPGQVQSAQNPPLEMTSSGTVFTAECIGMNPKGTYVNFVLPNRQRASCFANGLTYNKGERYKIEIGKLTEFTDRSGNKKYSYDCRIIGKAE